MESSRVSVSTAAAVVAVLLLVLPPPAGAARKCGEPWGAAQEGNVEVVRACLDEGMPLTVTDDKGHTLMMYAAVFGRSGVVKLLLERGADANVVADDGQTALIEATLYGDAESVRLLLARGASVHPRLAAGGREMTALGLAQWKGYSEIADLLRAAGARTMVAGQLQDELHSALLFGDAAKVRSLLEQGADVDGQWGAFHLDTAAQEGDAAKITALLDFGADVNGRGEFGQTALQMAALHGRPAAVRVLLGRRADVNATDRGGRTALSEAEGARGVVDPGDQGKYDEIIRMLRAQGAR